MPHSSGPQCLPTGDSTDGLIATASTCVWGDRHDPVIPLLTVYRAFRPAFLFVMVAFLIPLALSPSRAGAAGSATAESSEPGESAKRHGDWQYGAYLDVSYGLNFNFPENHRFRSRGTTARTNELAPTWGWDTSEKKPARTRAGAWNSEAKAATTRGNLPMARTDRLLEAQTPCGISAMPTYRISRRMD